MTERLYYDDAYLTAFDATVTDCDARDGVYHVRLDRSAFYPTSGGQPFDTGSLGGARVLDVYAAEDGDVVHALDRPLAPGAAVHGEIDWPRRFDHMQQHAGDHMIASALWRLLGGVTIGLHIGRDVSTIDVAMPDGITRIGPEEIRRVEADVNARIQRDVPVRCWFPAPDELKALPLRKPPTVAEHVRVVAIGEDEMVACGGTHPSTAGQLGMVKIIDASPARGKMRVSFLAGMRAFSDYQSKYEIAQRCANRFSTAVENLPEHIAATQDALKNAEYELNRLRREAALERLTKRMEAAPALPGGEKLVAEMLGGPADLLREVASQLIKRPGRIALLGTEVEAGHAMFVFARSADVQIHMGKLMAAAAKPFGGKGGGRPDFAQGGGSPQMLEAAEKLLKTDQSIFN